MLFQSLDDKRECKAIYVDGDVHYNSFPSGLTKTWNYTPHFSDVDIQYAQMYCGGLSLPDASRLSPETDKSWQVISKKMKAYINSFIEAKISLTEHCFYDLVPERFLADLCEVKNEISNHVFDNFSKPENYNFMVPVVAMVDDISRQSLLLNKESARNHLGTHQGRNLWKNIDSLSRHIKYNPYGTKTGRLSTAKGSFPILTLNKDFRDIIVPKNDWLVELDFNAAELRTLLGLCGKQQPTEDIHMWNVKNVYRGMVSREEAKQKIFAWLYNPKSTDYLSSRAYMRNEVLEAHWTDGIVRTPFKRNIQADGKHALNYLIQSTSSDVFLDRATKIHQFLSDRKSNISMLIHDSVVLDLHEEDMKDLKKIVDIFSNTVYGRYKVGVSAGKTFGTLRRVR